MIIDASTAAILGLTCFALGLACSSSGAPSVAPAPACVSSCCPDVRVKCPWNDIMDPKFAEGWRCGPPLAPDTVGCDPSVGSCMRATIGGRACFLGETNGGAEWCCAR